MKKFRFALAFILSLFFVLFFNACNNEKFPNPEKDNAIVVAIEQNYLALKPSVLTKSSYDNPHNIFLEKSAGAKNQTIYGWYKKTNGVYQIVSLKDKLAIELDTDLAYEIIDTLNVNQEIYRINKNDLYQNLISKAYQNGSICIKEIKEKEMLSQYFWLKTKFMTSDFLLNYNPKTKSFSTSKTKVVSEIKTDLGPIILVLLFLFFTIGITLRDKIHYLEGFRENNFKNHFIENDHKLNSLILFLLVIAFNFVYFMIWESNEIVFTIFITVVLSLFARLIYWPDKLINDNNHFQFTKLSSIFIITSFLALELFFIEASKIFGLISLVVVFSPALINLIFELIKYIKWKKSIQTPENLNSDVCQ